MGAYLSRPIKTKVSSCEQNSRLAYGVSSMQGWRIKQEDAHNCILNFDENCSLFGVYDGHGGFEVAKYTAEELPNFVKSTEEYKNGHYKEALISAFLGFDDTIPTKKVTTRLTEIIKSDKSEGDSEVEESDQSTSIEGPQSSCCRKANNDENVDVDYEFDEGEPEPDTPDTLRRDANRPLEEVMASYCVPSVARLIAGERNPASPYLRGRKDTAAKGECSSSFTSECTTSFVEPDTCSSSTANECSSSSGDGEKAAEQSTAVEKAADTSDIKAPVNGHANENENSEVTEKETVQEIAETCKSPKISKGEPITNGPSNEALVNGTTSPVNGDVKEKQAEPDSEGGSKNVSPSKQSDDNPTSTSTPSKKKKLALTDLDDSTVVKNFITNDEIDESDEEDSEDETFQLDGFGDCDSSDEDDEEESFVSRLQRRLRQTVEDDDDEDDDDDDDEDHVPTSSDINEEAEAEGEDEEDEDNEDEESLDGEEESSGSEEESVSIFADAGDKPGVDSGCTAVVALIKDDYLYVANAGDSRCVLSKNGVAVDMSEDHKPEDDIERNRIMKAGGAVTADGRVNGGLNLSRAIGDHGYKKNADLPNTEQMITALPDVRVCKIEPNVDFIVLACDGIWNSMSSQEVVSYIHPKIKNNVKLSDICEELFEECLAPNTLGDGTGCDNMTCIIVKPFHGVSCATKVDTDAGKCDSGVSEVVTQTSSEEPSVATSCAEEAIPKPEDGTADSTGTIEEDATDSISQKRNADSIDDDAEHISVKRQKTDDNVVGNDSS